MVVVGFTHTYFTFCGTINADMASLCKRATPRITDHHVAILEQRGPSAQRLFRNHLRWI